MAIEIHVEDGIALFQMTGRTASNSFSRQSLAEIRDALDSLLNDESVRGIVLTGEGRFFSAGADIKEFQRCIEDGSIVKFIHDLTGMLHPLLLRIRRSAKVVIAAIDGAAAGGGLGLALACDARIAGPGAKLAASYAGIGLSPDGGTTWLLPRLVGDQVSRTFFFENQVWNSQTAFEYGAVEKLSDDPIEEAIELARKWSKWGEHTREATKHLLDIQSVQDLETHLDHERLLIKAAGTTDDFAEGVAAFLEKRNPEFN